MAIFGGCAAKCRKSGNRRNDYSYRSILPAQSPNNLNVLLSTLCIFFLQMDDLIIIFLLFIRHYADVHQTFKTKPSSDSLPLDLTTSYCKSVLLLLGLSQRRRKGDSIGGSTFFEAKLKSLQRTLFAHALTMNGISIGLGQVLVSLYGTLVANVCEVSMK
jgi:hypothetical protein